MHSGFLSFLNRSFDSFKNSLMLDKGTFQLIPTYLLTIFISNLVRVKKSLLCLGHREALIAWPRSSNFASKRHYRFRTYILCTSLFKVSSTNAMLQKQCYSLTTPTHSAGSSIRYRTGPPLRLTTQTKSPGQIYDIHSISIPQARSQRTLLVPFCHGY